MLWRVAALNEQKEAAEVKLDVYSGEHYHHRGTVAIPESDRNKPVIPGIVTDYQIQISVAG